MGLLKFHFSFSVLCLLAFLGMRYAFRETYIKNGYMRSKKNRHAKDYLVFFIPGLNALMAIIAFVLLFVTQDDIENYRNDYPSDFT